MVLTEIKMDPFQNFSELFKVLSHPVRLAVLAILRDGEQCVCHMEAKLGLRQAYISQQLMVLRQVGIIEDRREGWNIFYRVIKPEIYILLEQAGGILGEQFTFPSSDTQPSKCPCPKCNPPEEAIVSNEQIREKE
jgi:DNA-binding transcriptional ArsR family regulator